ncbi:unnamed protein product [Prunus armeniaca]|uniref:Uncharacterized protein n=1 Tax=Prunus armeniaca TaxID=36596 RepID=A0A6J5W3M8_PRUAR|nr:unnamed protein product [Prunus armeniaca]
MSLAVRHLLRAEIARPELQLQKLLPKTRKLPKFLCQPKLPRLSKVNRDPRDDSLRNQSVEGSNSRQKTQLLADLTDMPTHPCRLAKVMQKIRRASEKPLRCELASRRPSDPKDYQKKKRKNISTLAERQGLSKQKGSFEKLQNSTEPARAP